MHQKISRLLEDRSKADISGRAGFKSKIAISNIINKKSDVRVSTALKVARALNVPLDWLADDSQDWPPPASASVLDQAMELIQPRTKRRFEAMSLKYGGPHVVLAGAIEFLTDAANAGIHIAVDAGPDEMTTEDHVTDEIAGEAMERITDAAEMAKRIAGDAPPGNPRRQSDADDDAA